MYDILHFNLLSFATNEIMFVVEKN